MRFFAIATGDHDYYVERFVQADCPEEAAIKYAKCEYYSYTEIATIYEAVIDEHGVLRADEEICKIELIGPKGYLWDNNRWNEDRKKCLLCGDFDNDDPAFVNDNSKCKSCANLRTIRAV